MNNIFSTVQKLLILAISVFFLACENPNTIGYQFGNGDFGAASYTDTLTLNTATILADSNVNANGSYLLAGMTTDPVFGKIKAVAYFQPSLQISSSTSSVIPFTYKDNPIADSVILYLRNSGLVFGDSVTMNTFRIHRLKSSIGLSKNLNGDESLPYETTPLTSFTINKRSFQNATYDSTRAFLVKLPLSICQEFLTVSATNGADNSLFNAAFRGFAIVPDNNAKTVFTFNTGTTSDLTCFITPFWHYAADTLQYGYSFDLFGPRFSQLTFDRSGTPLQNLTKTNNSVNAKLTNNLTYVQGGSGISTSIDLSAVKKLGTKIKTSKAFLSFNTSSASTSINFPKVYNFVMAEIDDKNQQKRTTDNYREYFVSNGVGYSGLISTYVDSTNSVVFDITHFLQNIENGKSTNYKMAIIPAKVNSSGFGILANDNLRRSVFVKPKLSIYYTKY